MLKLKGDIKLGQGLGLQLLCLATCVENVGPQRERRLRLTKERNRRRPYDRRVRPGVEMFIENAIPRLRQSQVPHLSLGVLEVTPISRQQNSCFSLSSLNEYLFSK